MQRWSDPARNNICSLGSFYIDFVLSCLLSLLSKNKSFLLESVSVLEIAVKCGQPWANCKGELGRGVAAVQAQLREALSSDFATVKLHLICVLVHL